MSLEKAVSSANIRHCLENYEKTFERNDILLLLIRCRGIEILLSFFDQNLSGLLL